jgi:hypothetical protein
MDRAGGRRLIEAHRPAYLSLAVGGDRDVGHPLAVLDPEAAQAADRVRAGAAEREADELNKAIFL